MRRRRSITLGKVVEEPMRFLTVKQVAERLGLAERTIRNQMSEGRFPIRWKKPGGKPVFLNKDVERYMLELPYENERAMGTLPSDRA